MSINKNVGRLLRYRDSLKKMQILCFEVVYSYNLVCIGHEPESMIYHTLQKDPD